MDVQPLIRGQPWWSKQHRHQNTTHTHIYERQPRLQTVCNVLTWIWIWRSYFWNGKQNVLYIQNRHDIMKDSVSTETVELGGSQVGLLIHHHSYSAPVWYKRWWAGATEW